MLALGPKAISVCIGGIAGRAGPGICQTASEGSPAAHDMRTAIDHAMVEAARRCAGHGPPGIRKPLRDQSHPCPLAQVRRAALAEDVAMAVMPRPPRNPWWAGCKACARSASRTVQALRSGTAALRRAGRRPRDGTQIPDLVSFPASRIPREVFFRRLSLRPARGRPPVGAGWHPGHNSRLSRIGVWKWPNSGKRACRTSATMTRCR